MPDSIGPLIFLMIALQIKHMLADFFLQTESMLDRRSAYFHKGRAFHAFVHAVLSFLCFMLIGAPVAFALALVLAEWVIHFHIDYWKGRMTAARELTPADAAYWRATGFDQALHQLTYVAMVTVWLIVPTPV